MSVYPTSDAIQRQANQSTAKGATPATTLPWKKGERRGQGGRRERAEEGVRCTSSVP